jgi:hypothetical protein
VNVSVPKKLRFRAGGLASGINAIRQSVQRSIHGVPEFRLDGLSSCCFLYINEFMLYVANSKPCP